MDVDALEEQPVRSETRCPECDGEPTETVHQLSALGYLHDDQTHICENGHQWTSGVPIGEFDRPEMIDDLRCDSCGTWMLPHRPRLGPSGLSNYDITFDMKCPDDECNYWTQIGRNLDDHGCGLFGYPQITGQTEGAEPYGYEE